MTLKTFYRKLKDETRRKHRHWKIKASGFGERAIRTGNQCPLTMLGHKRNISEWDVVAHSLGIPHRTAVKIVDAADGAAGMGSSERRIRAKLLKILNLKELGY